MSSYKVIQDVEAEDHLIGPLSLRQFIYAGICVICLYLCYFLSTHGGTFFVVFLLPVALTAGFFAFPWGRDQPTEVWALAKIRFMIKPRRRIWNQSGVKELVTITAPKQLHVEYTNGLTQSQVRSRLRALADTIDSRGWAIKNSNLNLTTQTPLTMAEPASDRLVGPSALPQAVPNIEILASDDILDEKNNATAGRVDTMISAASSAHRKKIVESLKKESPDESASAGLTAPKTNTKNSQPNNYWFLNQPNQSAAIPSNMVTFNTQVVTPGMTTDADAAAPALTPEQEEAKLVAELDARKSTMPTTAYYSHLHTIQPLSAQQRHGAAQPPAGQAGDQVQGAQPSGTAVPMPPTTVQSASPAPLAPPVQQPAPPPVTPAQQAAILQLANNNDLNVATIAREAERAGPQDEVVIKLH
jgi:hypothetical protein